jgi:hypothetical protein
MPLGLAEFPLARVRVTLNADEIQAFDGIGSFCRNRV